MHHRGNSQSMQQDDHGSRDDATNMIFGAIQSSLTSLAARSNIESYVVSYQAGKVQLMDTVYIPVGPLMPLRLLMGPPAQ